MAAAARGGFRILRNDFRLLHRHAGDHHRHIRRMVLCPHAGWTLRLYEQQLPDRDGQQQRLDHHRKHGVYLRGERQARPDALRPVHRLRRRRILQRGHAGKGAHQRRGLEQDSRWHAHGLYDVEVPVGDEHHPVHAVQLVHRVCDRQQRQAGSDAHGRRHELQRHQHLQRRHAGDGAGVRQDVVQNPRQRLHRLYDDQVPDDHPADDHQQCSAEQEHGLARRNPDRDHESGKRKRLL